MRTDSPRWEEINPSGYAHEKDGLLELARYLPDADPFHVWANVEFVAGDSSVNEIDALVLTRSGLDAGSEWRRLCPTGRVVVGRVLHRPAWTVWRNR